MAGKNAPGKMLGEKWAHAAEYARGEKAQGETQYQHGGVAERDGRVCDGDCASADREDQEGEAPADTVGEIPGGEVTEKCARNGDSQITGGIEDREAALGTKKRRQPGGDGEIAALRAGAHQAAE